MTQPESPQPTPSGAARLKKRGRKHSSAQAKTGWLIAAIAAIFCAGIVLSGGGIEFLHSLYSPVVLIVVIFLIVEYILLKGRDRSHLYRVELDQMREKRRHEGEIVRSIEREMAALSESLAQLERSASTAPGDCAAEIRRIRARLDELRETLAQRP